MGAAGTLAYHGWLGHSSTTCTIPTAITHLLFSGNLGYSIQRACMITFLMPVTVVSMTHPPDNLNWSLETSPDRVQNLRKPDGWRGGRGAAVHSGPLPAFL